MCAVVGCYKHHCKGSLISFYHCPIEAKRQHRWIDFVFRQNANGTAWKSGEGDHLCSEHFVSKKNSDSPNSPDYVPSVYPETLAKKSSWAASASSLARFERVQRRSTTNEMERLATKREEESNILFVHWALKTFKNDCESYCKVSAEQPYEAAEQVLVCQPGRLSSIGAKQQSPCIPAEVGKILTTGDVIWILPLQNVKTDVQGDLTAKLQNEVSILKASLLEKP